MRARNIKPGFFKNEDLAECSVWARLLFAGLWCMADRDGRLEDRPKRIKGELLAYDSQEVGPLLDELASRGFILRYQVDGRPLIQIPTFAKHQNPHHREAPSTLPGPQSPGLAADGTAAKPEAGPGLDPPRDDLARGSSRADSLIPDSGSGTKDKARASKSRSPASTVLLRDVDPQRLADWEEVRKAKRAGPITSTVADGVRREAQQAGLTVDEALTICCERGWQSFKAEWVRERETATQRQLETAGLMTGARPRTATERKVATIEALTGRARRTPQDFTDIDYTEGVGHDGIVQG